MNQFISVDKVPGIDVKEYDFLETNPNLGDNIMALFLSGSRSFGTNVETSDYDIKGFALQNTNSIFGIEKSFDNVSLHNPDTVIYSLDKICGMFLGNNPTVLEMLFTEKNDILYMTEFGKKIYDIRHAFLHKRAISSFGGWATASFNQMQNVLNTNRDGDPAKNEMSSLNCMISAFNAEYNQDVNIKLSIGENGIVLNGRLSDMDISKAKILTSQLSQIHNEYGKPNKRNRREDKDTLSKHIEHTVRVYMEAIELITTGTMHTKRTPEELKILMPIRTGHYVNDDATEIDKMLYDIIEEYKQKFCEACNRNVLSDEPNMKLINHTLTDIYRQKLRIDE